MRYISKETLIEHLELVIEKSELVIERSRTIATHHDYLQSPERMEKFDAACMLIQVIGETAKRIDDWTAHNLLSHYPQVYWRGVFGCRNIISHEYGNVDPEQIFSIIKKHLPELINCTQTIIENVRKGAFDGLILK